MDKLLIIDGHNLLFRMFYGMPSSVINRCGEDIKGTMGFIGGLNKLIKFHKPQKLIIIFDSETSIKDKLEMHEDYKQNRIDYSVLPDSENPFSQLKHIYKVLTHLNIHFVESKECEADDYIASICEQLKFKYELMIVSNDKDFLQLVDEQVTVFDPLGKGKFYTPEAVLDKYGITPSQVIDYKVMVGDKSDNIPGVPGVGAKTAVKILDCGTLEQLEHIKDALGEKLYQKLHEHQSIIERNRQLITMNRFLDITIDVSLINIDHNIYKRTMDILRECEIY